MIHITHDNLVQAIENGRKAVGVSKAELCRRSGLTRSAYYSFLNGQSITTKTFMTLVETLNLFVYIKNKKNEGDTIHRIVIQHDCSETKDDDQEGTEVVEGDQRESE